MKNEKLMVNKIFLTKDYEAFRAYFLQSMGELQKDWSPGLNVAALVVSLNLPWPSKFTEKLIIIRRLIGVLQKLWQL